MSRYVTMEFIEENFFIDEIELVNMYIDTVPNGFVWTEIANIITENDSYISSLKIPSNRFISHNGNAGIGFKVGNNFIPSELEKAINAGSSDGAYGFVCGYSMNGLDFDLNLLLKKGTKISVYVANSSTAIKPIQAYLQIYTLTKKQDTGVKY